MRGKRNLYQPGEIYGLLTIKERWTEKCGKHKSKETICRCECQCGGLVTAPARYIANGHKQSCGCLRHVRNNKHHGWKGHGEIGLSVWADIKAGAIRRARQIPFEITIEGVWDLFLKQNRKCAISGVPIQFSSLNRKYCVEEHTASLDRVDSKKGYTLDNVQWVHKKVNLMKMTLPQDEFIQWCKIISEHQKIIDPLYPGE